jgi:pyruvate/2-oxoglutarate dehydrogenase complex dihydrolipoamide dehydrogenase (E3) component
VEERLVGGECGFYASMPSKALLHPAEALDEIRHVPGAREAADGQRAVQAVLDNRDSIISDLDDSDQLPWLEDNDISLYHRRGNARRRRRRYGTTAVVTGACSEPTRPRMPFPGHTPHREPAWRRAAHGGFSRRGPRANRERTPGAAR